MQVSETQVLSQDEFKKQTLEDYRVAFLSREVSLLGRKEVLTGKAKFGIFGDGKELPQIAMAKVFRNGDFRSGYYRDQTFMMAIEQLNVQGFFAQLYAATDLNLEKSSGGRQMTSHFSTTSLNADGSWKKLVDQKNSSADISPTAGQMPRLLGLAHASKLYRDLPEADPENTFSRKGNEIAFGTIGDASTSEGHFWETLNAAGVLQVPMVLSIWDDAYGISVPARFQRTKSNLSEVLKGFQRTEEERGIELLQVKAWDYPALIKTYKKAEALAREQHIPVVVHVQECTQPQGHSTSGSHERYKSSERLEWEKKHDGIVHFRNWLLNYSLDGTPFFTEEEINQLEEDCKKHVKAEQKEAWKAYQSPILALQKEALKLLQTFASNQEIKELVDKLMSLANPFKKDVFSAVRKAIRLLRDSETEQKKELTDFVAEHFRQQQEIYSSHLTSNDAHEVPNVPAELDTENKVDGRIVLRDNFDALFAKYPNIITFGEDSGNIGDVNQGLNGLQEKYGVRRVMDTGIREATIIGQGIGLAMRGFRPIAEIQYLDYILYGLQGISDDLATVLYRTVGQQKAPAIIRTRGHRLEGIWHAGSPMGGILNLVRGVHVLVPRDLTKAAGFYNALLQGDTPAIVVESLNGYRLKESLPTNLGDFTTPIGQVEVTREGTDITLVTYGSTWRLVMDAAEELSDLGISSEVIDVQSLLPFDRNEDCKKSIAKTNRLLVIDEDVPGGASAFILQQILEKQQGFFHLDSAPATLTAKEHRPAYGTDGDYFSKPSVDDIVEKIYAIMHESNPEKFPY